jgi:hypothetical protein
VGLQHERQPYAVVRCDTPLLGIDANPAQVSAKVEGWLSQLQGALP